jgi:hypothetical protein
MLVIRIDQLYLLGDLNDWLLKGLVAVRNGLLVELEKMDSILRENERDNLERQAELITEFGKRKAYPLFYWKKQLTDNWERGANACWLRNYEDKGDKLAYTRVWIYIFACILGGVGTSIGRCYIGPFVADLRYGMATLHLQTKPYAYIIHFNATFKWASFETSSLYLKRCNSSSLVTSNSNNFCQTLTSYCSPW